MVTGGRGTDVLTHNTWSRSEASALARHRPGQAPRRRQWDVSAALVDVGVRDRFEALLHTDPEDAVGAAAQLQLYDVTRRRTLVVAGGAGLVLCRGDVLRWSTGGRTVTSWHTLDLRTLA
ncbi:hypothetical protein ACGF5C_27840 [Micromonospora sp. NPDC047620]|uniref:hypothetical protein n=1 Tax=Micromonospora sp. NPDC047620 TaxID=3364251 RepID=UPI003712E210